MTGRQQSRPVRTGPSRAAAWAVAAAVLCISASPWVPGALAAGNAVAPRGPHPQDAPAGPAHPAVAEMDVALHGFVNGDTTAWKGILSRGEGASLFGGWGGYEKGWEQLEPRYDWAASRFRPGSSEVQQEIISSGGDADFYYTVALERSSALLAGQTEASLLVLRVTHIYGREGEAWKLLHRHADPLFAIQTTESVIGR